MLFVPSQGKEAGLMLTAWHKNPDKLQNKILVIVYSDKQKM